MALVLSIRDRQMGGLVDGPQVLRIVDTWIFRPLVSHASYMLLLLYSRCIIIFYPSILPYYILP